MNCTHCGKPITLIPSAEERAKKYGGTPEFYRRLFSMHSGCIIEKRRQQTQELIQRIKEKQ